MKKFLNKVKTFFFKILCNLKKFIMENKFYNIFVITNVFNALLLRIFTVNNGLDPRPLIQDFVVILAVGSIVFLFKKDRTKLIYLTVVSIICVILCVINSMYYTFYTSFASVSLLATSVFVIDVGDAVTKNVMNIKDFIYLWQPIVLLISYWYISRNTKRENIVAKSSFNFVTSLILSGTLLLIFVSTLTGTDWSRFYNQWNREYLVSRFGLYTYQLNDIVKSIEPKINTLFGSDKALKTFNEYYDVEKEEITNKYTNVFEGKNIISIHLESMQAFTMDLTFNDKEVTPNLNKLAKSGLNFTNFYSQVSVGTSSDSEFTLNTSLLPVSNGTVFVNYWNREYVSIPSLLKEKGYYTFSMHGNTGDYWNRNIMHKQLGYDKFYSKSSYDIDEVIGLGISDKSFFRQSVEKIKKIAEGGKPFYGTLIMLTNHTPFDETDKYGEFDLSVTVDVDGEQVTRNHLDNTKLGNYIKSVHYADEALGEFVQMLDEAGLLENTVLVLYGDHDARISKKEYINFYNYDSYTDTYFSKNDENYHAVSYYVYELLRRVPFIIWTKEGKYVETIDKVMGMYDVMPTLGNMFNFYNKYQLGHDIFSIDENIVIFPNGNFLTDKIYYNSQKDEGKWLNDALAGENYITYNKEYTQKTLEASNMLIMYDLIRISREKKEGEVNENTK